MIQKFLSKSSAVLIAVFCFSVFAAAQASDVAPASAVASTAGAATSFANIKIGNFGQMDERFYRGAQPLQNDFQSLKDLGITTVIDLRNDPTDYEKGAVEALGMKYVNIPMSGWKSPKMEDINTFLSLVDNPETGKFFVHCKAGIHRTGVAGAVYRYTKYSWDYDQVYKEMKDYNYSNGLVHGKLGSFVKKWGVRNADERAAKINSGTAQPVVAQP
jgi:protein tyrosine/serine phosphatase